jgi:serine protease Do
MRHSVVFGVLALTAALGLSRGAVALVDPAYSHGGGGAMSSRGPQGYLGVDLREVNEDQMAVLKLKEPRGVEIVNVDHDGPACKAGLRVHDVILQMNGQVIDGVEQLRRMLRETLPGRTVNLLLSHDGQQQTVSVQLANRETIEREAWQQRYKVPEPDPLPENERSIGGTGFLNSGTAGRATKGMHGLLGTTMIVSSSFTGAKLEVMGPQLAEFFGAQGSAGLLVRSVDANSPAADAGMRAGDVVVKVNSISVVNGNDWTKTIHENRGKSVPVVVLRDKKEQTLTLTPDGKKRSSLERGMGFEEFFGSDEQAEQTREVLAQLQPLFDSMAADARRRMEAVRYSPEMAQMMARLEVFAADPQLRENLETARKQVDAAAEAARRAADANCRLRMN